MPPASSSCFLWVSSALESALSKLLAVVSTTFSRILWTKSTPRTVTAADPPAAPKMVSQGNDIALSPHPELMSIGRTRPEPMPTEYLRGKLLRQVKIPPRETLQCPVRAERGVLEKVAPETENVW